MIIVTHDERIAAMADRIIQIDVYKRQLFVWLCTGLIYISGLVLGLLSTVIALLGVAVLLTYSPQNGVIQMCIRDRLYRASSH